VLETQTIFFYLFTSKSTRDRGVPLLVVVRSIYLVPFTSRQSPTAKGVTGGIKDSYSSAQLYPPNSSFDRIDEGPKSPWFLIKIHTSSVHHRPAGSIRSPATRCARGRRDRAARIHTSGCTHSGGVTGSGSRGPRRVLLRQHLLQQGFDIDCVGSAAGTIVSTASSLTLPLLAHFDS